jgi:hypothetical protein
VDLKKEIKLSDLFPGRKTAAAEEPKAEKPKKERKPFFAARQPSALEGEQRKAQASCVRGRKKKLVGLKIGASADRCRPGRNNGGAQVTQVARE